MRAVAFGLGCAVVACSAPTTPGTTGDARAAVDGAADADAAITPPEPYEIWRRHPLYELYVRHFSPSGTFRGVEDRLPELRALGIGTIWLLPVNQIGSIVPANGGAATDAPWGNPYAVKSYEHVAAEYGSDGTVAGAEADLRHLVDHAHALGLRVILDWVPNHTAWDNPLVTEHPDWYAHAGDAIRAVDGFPWIAQLDWSKPDLRAYMTAQLLSWRERFDLDGFRIDFAHGMPIDYFAQLRPQLEQARPVLLLGEAGDPAFHPAFDLTYDWDVYPRLGDVAHGADVGVLDDALLQRQLIPYAGQPDALIMRMTYNHDDNGNFTLQDRYLGGVRAAFVLAATLPGVPMILDGQETGMRVSDAQTVQVSAPLGHDPHVKLDWSDPDDERSFYTRLFQLARCNTALAHAGMDDFRKLDTQPADHVYALVRRHGTDVVVVVLNLSGAELPAVNLTPTANAGSIDGTYTELFTGATTSLAADTSLHLGPWAYRVYVQGPLGGT